jgi:hypothetical protein
LARGRGEPLGHNWTESSWWPHREECNQREGAEGVVVVLEVAPVEGGKKEEGIKGNSMSGNNVYYN